MPLNIEESAIAAELNKLQIFIEFAAQLDQMPEDATVELRSEPLTIAHGEVVASAPRASKKLLVVKQAEKLIQEQGPMTSRQILAALDATGHRDLVGGKDEQVRLSNISSIMSREKTLFVSGPAGYKIRESNPEKTEAPASVARQEGLLVMQ